MAPPEPRPTRFRPCVLLAISTAIQIWYMVAWNPFGRAATCRSVEHSAWITCGWRGQRPGGR
ncbi:hypothetical protein RHCRD62_20015 [Rhodococcus sp. RD6.2]|nr:hypothetical protein RHCRD62_20015 [Rhodococcus sp. RD6.2]